MDHKLFIISFVGILGILFSGAAMNGGAQTTLSDGSSHEISSMDFGSGAVLDIIPTAKGGFILAFIVEDGIVKIVKHSVSI